jgi:hypothetical protein
VMELLFSLAASQIELSSGTDCGVCGHSHCGDLNELDRLPRGQLPCTCECCLGVVVIGIQRDAPHLFTDSGVLTAAAMDAEIHRLNAQAERDEASVAGWESYRKLNTCRTKTKSERQEAADIERAEAAESTDDEDSDLTRSSEPTELIPPELQPPSDDVGGEKHHGHLERDLAPYAPTLILTRSRAAFLKPSR